MRIDWAAAPVGAVATPDFAIDHRRADRLFGTIIRRVDARLAQEGEKLMPMSIEMAGQSAHWPDLS